MLQIKPKPYSYEGLMLSPSALSTFAQCGFKYGFRYAHRLQTPQRTSTVFGSVVHKTCELIAKGTLVEETAISNFLYDKVDAGLKRFPIGDTFETYWLRNYWLHKEWGKQLKMTVNSYPIVETELHLEKVVTVAGVSFGLHGYIDARTETDTLIDWKAARSKNLSDEYIQQLKFYAALYTETKAPSQVELVIFPKIKTVHRFRPYVHKFTVTVAEQRRILWVAGLMAKSICQGNFIPNRTLGNVMCQSCDYRTVCDKVLEGQIGELSE